MAIPELKESKKYSISYQKNSYLQQKFTNGTLITITPTLSLCYLIW